MKAYAFPVKPCDITNVLLELRNIGARWGDARELCDPLDFFINYVETPSTRKYGIALYIRERKRGDSSYYYITYSHITYLKEEFSPKAELKGFVVVDSFYSIPEFASYSDLGDNTINFCEI